MRAFPPITESIAVNGYALIRGHRPNFSSLDALADFGQIDTIEGLNSVQSLVPYDISEAPPNTYSGNFGVAEFPLHTDLAHWAVPPRYLALRCIHGSESVATKVLDGWNVTNHFRTALLRTILVQPRRPMRNGKQLLPLLERADTPAGFRLRWDSVYLRPATTHSTELFANVSAFISQAQPPEFVLLERGDTLIVDNWRCLHGRTSAHHNAKTRQIDRAYLRSIS
jgi:L-asparagine oxygenase